MHTHSNQYIFKQNIFYFKSPSSRTPQPHPQPDTCWVLKRHGLRLNSLCRSILKTLDSDESRDIFLEKLANAGFTFESVYDEYVYEIKLLDAYTVTEDFPKLKKEAIPEGISKVQYDLLLATIVQFKEY